MRVCGVLFVFFKSRLLKHTIPSLLKQLKYVNHESLRTSVPVMQTGHLTGLILILSPSITFPLFLSNLNVGVLACDSGTTFTIVNDKKNQ